MKRCLFAILCILASDWPGLASAETDPASFLSALGEAPDWSRLDPLQKTISRADFLHEWTTIYYGGSSPIRTSPLVEILEDRVRIVKSFKRPGEVYELFFAPESVPFPPGRTWRGIRELPPASSPGKPLDGVRIAIDPGHIGGEWARMEERWFLIPERPVPGEPQADAAGDPPSTPPSIAVPAAERQAVKEGEIVLRVAQLLETELTGQGAEVTLVRRTLEPVTARRPSDFFEIARTAGHFPPDTDPAHNRALASAAEKLFYLSDEIRERGKKINLTIKPDFVLCLHVNAEPWGNSESPAFVEANHFHMLINGTYSDPEISFDDQRFELIHRLVERIHPEEVEMATTAADVMAEATGLPPYVYPGSNASRTPTSEFVWSRNLLATRVYDCPVLFFEPYVMNNEVTYERVQAGEYEGTREFFGKAYVNIYREYADAVAEGITTYFRNHRRQSPGS
jgi:hypothetical protein